MKLFVIGLLVLFFDTSVQSQDISLNNYSILLNDGILTVKDEGESVLLTRSFHNPVSYLTDLDSDASDEYLIIDSIPGSGYLLYVYSTIDTFYLADSINSGPFEPYYTIPEDLGEVILVTGNSAFTFSGTETILPINCLKYESGELYEVNDEIYDLFISENDGLVDYLNGYYETNARDCASTEKVKDIITAIYSNYINAAEHSLASQFLRNYYLCQDLDQYREKLDKLLETQEE
jgi:hypothetical protein